MGRSDRGRDRPPSRGSTGSVNALCLLADGRLASGSGDGTIRLWDAATGAETARLEGHAGAVNALCLLTDGRLASGSRDGTIRLWDMASRGRDRPPRRARRLGQRSMPPDGRAARLGLWRQDDPAVGRCGRGRDRPPRGAHRPCQRSVPARGRAARLGLWTGRSGCGTRRPAPRPPASRGTPAVSALCLLPDGRLASGSVDKTIRLWDVATGAETARLEGHAGSVTALCLLHGRAARLGLARTRRSGCGICSGRGRDRPPRGASSSLLTPLCPAGGRAARLGLWRTGRSGCGT